MPPAATLSALPSNPSLVAILLVARTRAGPSLAFHYPLSPDPSAASSSRLDAAWYGNPGTQLHDLDDSDEDRSDDTDERTEDEADDTASVRALSRLSAGAKTGTGGRASASIKSRAFNLAGGDDQVDEELVDESHVKSRHHSGSSGEGASNAARGPESNRLLGYTHDGLSKLLSPSRTFNKRCFEVSVDGLVFVSAPRFAYEDGSWRRERRRSKKTGDESKDDDSDEAIDMTADDHLEDQPTQSSRCVPVPLGTTPSSDAGSDGLITGSDLAMYNLVFVLNPSALEYRRRVDDMYEHVAKKFAKTLKHEQAHHAYISQEIRIMSRLKEQAKEEQTPMYAVWQRLMKESTLANAIALTFDAISNSKIANIRLSKKRDASFKLPLADSTSSLPTPFQPQMPGLWLTTADASDLDDDVIGDGVVRSPHFALLLLEDKSSLLKEVESDRKGNSTKLAFLIRNLTPTKSLQRLSTKLSVDLRDLIILARHLIYWRRARAIPPLRPGDIYIVSPNADTRQIHDASAEFATHFPRPLPSLPTILERLSGKPQAYKNLIPSTDHKERYMEILAWLMRGGWVTQLRTFGWIQVSPSVKAAVALKLTKQSERKNGQQGRLSFGSSDSPFTGDSMKSPSSTSTRSVVWSPEHRIKGAQLGDTLSPRSNPPFKSPLSRAEPDIGPLALNARPDRSTASTPLSTKTQRTVVGNKSDKKPSPLRLARSPSPAITSAIDTITITDSQPDDDETIEPLDTSSYTTSIVHNPLRASKEESEWIQHIGTTIDDEECRKFWPTMIKYFDGQHALEMISPKEGMKKKIVAGILARLGKEGVLFCVKRW